GRGPSRRRLPAVHDRSAVRRRGRGGRGPSPPVQPGAVLGPVYCRRRGRAKLRSLRAALVRALHKHRIVHHHGVAGRSGMGGARLAARVAGLRPTAVNAVLREVRQLQASGRELVSLMRGQPDTLTPTHIVEAARRALDAGRTGYPDNQGEPGLRRAVAEGLARDHGLKYDHDREILVTDGATLGVYSALAALAGPGD